MQGLTQPQKPFKDLLHLESEEKIFKTSDYSRFNLSDFNRNAIVRQKLLENIKQTDLTMYNPILVDKDGVIIDGQHRYLICQELGLPIYYIIGKKATIDDAAHINQASKNWHVGDFIEREAKKGNLEYIRLIQLAEQYNAPISALFRLGTYSGGQSINECVKMGQWKFKNWAQAQNILRDLQDFHEYYPEFSRTDKFFNAFTKLYQLEGYNHKRMKSKLETSSRTFHRQATTEALAQELLKLYNYKQTHRAEFNQSKLRKGALSLEKIKKSEGDLSMAI